MTVRLETFGRRLYPDDGLVCRILQHRCCGNAYTLLRAARLDEDLDRLPHGKKGQRFTFGCKGERQGLLAQAAGGADEGERDPLVADRKTCRGDIRRISGS